MSRGGEVITFQLGCFSNFIGSHFWNIQQEECNRLPELEPERGVVTRPNFSQVDNGYNVATFFSEHRGPGFHSQPSVRPRLVIVDLQGRVGNNPPGQPSKLTEHERTGCVDGTPAIATSLVELPSLDTANRISGLEAEEVPAAFRRRRHPFLTYLDNEQQASDELVFDEGSTRPDCPDPASGFISSSTASGQIPTQNIGKPWENLRWTATSFADFFTPAWNPELHCACIPQLFLDQQGIDGFERGGEGREFLSSGFAGREFCEQIEELGRHQLELADRVGCIHLLTDWKNGFAPICSDVLVEWLKDHVPNTSILLYSSERNRATQSSGCSEARLQRELGFRGAEGALFLQRCFSELKRESNLFVLSDFNVPHQYRWQHVSGLHDCGGDHSGIGSSIASVGSRIASAVPQGLDVRSRYDAAALPALVLDTLSAGYRTNGTACGIFHSIGAGNGGFAPLANVWCGCGASGPSILNAAGLSIQDKVTVETSPPGLTERASSGATAALSQLTRGFWNVSTSPSTGCSRVNNPQLVGAAPSSTQCFRSQFMSRGFTDNVAAQGASAVDCWSNTFSPLPAQCAVLFASPGRTPLGVSFPPLFGKSPSASVVVETLTNSCPWKDPLLLDLVARFERVRGSRRSMLAQWAATEQMLLDDAFNFIKDLTSNDSALSGDDDL